MSRSEEAFVRVVAYKFDANSGTGRFAVPQDMARHLEPNSEWTVEWTEVGILYRPHRGDEHLPDWVTAR